MLSEGEFPTAIADWQVTTSAEHGEHWTTCVVERKGVSGDLTVFARGVTDSEAFRAAFRRDVALLSGIDHPHLPRLMDHGEFAGQFFCVFAQAPITRLSAMLNEPHAFDERVDVIWQIASAIQQLHNAGLTHARLAAENIAVSDQLRTTLIAPCRSDWVATGKSSEQTFPQRIKCDLNELADLLDLTAEAIVTPDPAPQEVSTALSTMATELRQGRMIARDVQGRLGDLLLKQSGDGMEMIDDRTGQYLSRRSIVDELFEETEPQSVQPAEEHQTSLPRWIIPLLVTITLLLIAWSATR